MIPGCPCYHDEIEKRLFFPVPHLETVSKTIAPSKAGRVLSKKSSGENQDATSKKIEDPSHLIHKLNELRSDKAESLGRANVLK